ncbi:MAG: glycosyltransferase family 2 protein [Muribaculaceae bacterium]|nr:glycosyltransferase family 2 protein [Muribaculaceae bacterium]
MLVSIVIPVYRSRKYIEKCVRSVLDQTYKDIEIIIVDDGGKDGSIDIIKRVLMEYPDMVSKVRFIYHEFNKGCAAARRDGMKEAIGDYILQVDSDDYVDPTIVEKMVKKAQEDDADMVVCNYYYTTSTRRTLVEVIRPKDNLDFASKVLQGYIHAGAWNKMMRRSILKDHEIYPVAGINMGDDMTILMQALFFMNRISYVKDALYFYNCSGEERFSRSVYPMVNDIKLINLFSHFFEENKIEEKEVCRSFGLFKIGRLSRNLLYNDLDEVNRNRKVYNVNKPSQAFEHKRLPLHYKLVVYFYLKNFNLGVKVLRRLIRFKKNINVQ